MNGYITSRQCVPWAFVVQKAIEMLSARQVHRHTLLGRITLTVLVSLSHLTFMSNCHHPGLSTYCSRLRIGRGRDDGWTVGKTDTHPHEVRHACMHAVLMGVMSPI